MLNEVSLEQRLTTLEQSVLELQHKVNHQPNPNNWLEQLIGAISDDDAFDKALEYGRIFRQSDNPTELVE